MQKRNSFTTKAIADVHHSGPTSPRRKAEQRFKSRADRATMSVYIDSVLLPKQITDSFYATWLRCYEELFEASLSIKSPLFKFDLAASLSRKDSDKINLEKIEHNKGPGNKGDLKGTYTQKEATESVGEGEEQKYHELKEDSLAVAQRGNGLSSVVQQRKQQVNGLSELVSVRKLIAKTKQRSKIRMPVYDDKILLPKPVIESCYASIFRCYQEMFPCSFSSKTALTKKLSVHHDLSLCKLKPMTDDQPGTQFIRGSPRSSLRESKNKSPMQIMASLRRSFR
eukprot:gene7979-8836_t